MLWKIRADGNEIGKEVRMSNLLVRPHLQDEDLWTETLRFRARPSVTKFYGQGVTHHDETGGVRRARSYQFDLVWDTRGTQRRLQECRCHDWIYIFNPLLLTALGNNLAKNGRMEQEWTRMEVRRAVRRFL